jgi:hypothetical protein
MDDFPFPLTPTERVTLEWIEQGRKVSKGRLGLAKKNGWVTAGKEGPRLTDAGREALRNDLAAQVHQRNGLRDRR